MKILWLSPACPWPLKYGGGVRTYNLLREIAPNYEVTFCYLSDNPNIPQPLLDLCREVRVFSPNWGRSRARLRSLVWQTAMMYEENRSDALDSWLATQAGAFDVAIVEGTHMSWAQIPAGMFKILNLQNIESELLHRTAVTDDSRLRGLYRRLDAQKLKRQEFPSLHAFDHIWIPSEREVASLRDQGVETPITVVPNGVNLERFVPGERTPEMPDILFVGILHYFPNEQGILWFGREVWPLIQAQRPETTVGVIGGSALPSMQFLLSEKFQVYGHVPDVLPYYQGARLSVIPLLSGGGTRLKLLETAACGTPIVTTSIGCEGIPVENGVHCLIADQPEAFAASCLQLLDDQELASGMERSARELVHAQFSWRSIAARAMATLPQHTGEGVPAD